MSYDIETIGWTTDAVVKPFKGFDFHFLFTYQSPKYKKYETGVTFSDGTTSGINATGNIVTEIPKVLIELDPSYNITKDLKVWASFRYFSKTYANIKKCLLFQRPLGNIRWNKLECEQTFVLKRNCDKLLEPDRGERKYFGSRAGR